jgi:glyoxylase-like metal-dependent hydrolase (beta-lactamase superfamily II)
VTLNKVADGVSRVTGGVVNWYVVLDRGKATLVDAGVPGDWKLLLETLTSLGLSLGDIDCVLLTHAHSDHTGFAEQVRSEAGATVRVHTADETAARTGKGGKNEGGTGAYLKMLLRAEAYRTLFGLMRRHGLSIVPITAVTVFSDGEILDVPGRPRVLHVPGHTAGSCALHFEDRSVLCTGDSLITHDPFTGSNGPRVMPSIANIDTAEAVRSLDHLTLARAEVLLPGHGDPWKQGVAAAVSAARSASAA